MMSPQAMFVGGPWNGKEKSVSPGAHHYEMLDPFPQLGHIQLKHIYEYLTTSFDGVAVYVLAKSEQYALGGGAYGGNPYPYGSNGMKNPYVPYGSWLKDQPPVVQEKEPLKFTVTAHNVAPETAEILTGHTHKPLKAQFTSELEAWEQELLAVEPQISITNKNSIPSVLKTPDQETAKRVKKTPEVDYNEILEGSLLGESYTDLEHDDEDEDDPEVVQAKADKAAEEALKAALKKAAKTAKYTTAYGGVPVDISGSMQGVTLQGAYMDEVYPWEIGNDYSGDNFF